MNDEEFNYQNAVKQLTEEKSVWAQIWNSICTEMLPNGKNVPSTILTILFSVVFSGAIACSENTVQLVRDVCTTFLDVHIAIFGCIFAVYSVLLAFLSDSYIKKLLKIGYNCNVNYLKASTRYYESALYIFFIAILLSLIYKVGALILPEGFTLTNNNIANIGIAFILLVAYFLYAIRSVLELKSVIGNTLLLFRASLQFKILSFEEEENKK